MEKFAEKRSMRLRKEKHGESLDFDAHPILCAAARKGSLLSRKKAGIISILDKLGHIGWPEVMAVILVFRKRRLLSAWAWALACIGCFAAILLTGSRWQIVPASGTGQGSALRVVVIDPGHGGQDGGAVAADGTAESEINLAVSLRLEGILRFAGVPTEMTRREDVMVCDPGLSTMRQRKVSDIHNRVELVNGIPGAVLLSIHQNSLPSSPVTHGAQAFRNREPEAEALAQTMQDTLNTVVNTHRAKEPKQIAESIYLMNHVTVPAVLVECGFLSNEEETARLRQGAYQTKQAAAIAAGYLQWAAGEGTI